MDVVSWGGSLALLNTRCWLQEEFMWMVSWQIFPTTEDWRMGELSSPQMGFSQSTALRKKITGGICVRANIGKLGLISSISVSTFFEVFIRLIKVLVFWNACKLSHMPGESQLTGSWWFITVECLVCKWWKIYCLILHVPGKVITTSFFIDFHKSSIIINKKLQLFLCNLLPCSYNLINNTLIIKIMLNHFSDWFHPIWISISTSFVNLWILNSIY